ncbi:MAG: PQQ-binding-like beta-propeller repeat protein, partial [Candidatus Sumerlaeota bacterium]
MYRKMPIILLFMISAFLAPTLLADDWARFLGPRGDGVWREDGIVSEFPEEGLLYKWKVDIGPGYSSPAITNGRVYITDRFETPDGRDVERLLCLRENNGEIIWTIAWPAAYKSIGYATGPRSMPLVHDGRVYVLGSMGRLTCVDDSTGTEMWSKDYVEDFGGRVPTWGFAAQPLIEGDNLICIPGGRRGAVVALDCQTGATVWQALASPHAGYCQPVIEHLGGRRQTVVWLPDSINALVPETGEPLWSIPWQIGMGMSITRPAVEENRMAFSAQASGATVLQFEDN